MILLARVLSALALLVALSGPAPAQVPIPEHSGRVVDDAKVLDDAAKLMLDNRLAALEARTGDQVVVVTLPSLHDLHIEAYAREIAQHWVLGQSGKYNGGPLVLAQRGQGRDPVRQRSRRSARRCEDRPHHPHHHA